MSRKSIQSQITESGSFLAEESRLTYLRSNLDVFQGNAKNCSVCSKKFGFLNSESICMRCNRVLCKNCVVDKAKVVFVKGGKIECSKQKICKICDPDIKSHATISSQSRGFNKDTKVSVRWLKALGIIAQNASEQEEQKKLEELAGKYARVAEVQIVAAKDVKYKEFITSKMNYSYLQHVHDQLGESKIRFDEIQASISRLINKLAGHYQWKKLPMKVDILGLFILTFASEGSAFVILQHLLDNLLPPYIQQSLFLNSRYNQALSWQQKSTHFLKAVTTNIKDISKEKKKEVTIFLEKFGLDMLSSLFINILNLQCFFYALDRLILTKKFDHLESMLVWIILDSFPFMKELSNDSHEKVYGYLTRVIENETVQSLGDLIREPTSMSASEIKREEILNDPRTRAVSHAFNPMIDNGNNGFLTEEDHKKKPQQPSQDNNHNHSHNQHHKTHDHAEEIHHQKQMVPAVEDEEEEKVKHARKHRPQPTETPTALPVESTPEKIEKVPHVCQECPAKQRALEHLREEYDHLRETNEQHHSQIASLTRELQEKNEILAQQAHQIQQDHHKLHEHEAEILELKSAQKTSDLLQKYKALVASQKETLEQISQEKSKIEEKYVAEREKILVESIKEKETLINEIASQEQRRAEELQSSAEATEKLNKQLQSLMQENAKVAEELNNERQLLIVASRSREAAEEQLKWMKENSSLDAERSAVESDVQKETIKQLRETIDRLQADIAQSTQERKQYTQLFNEQNAIVYDELRKQINCLEARILELEEELKKTQQKMEEENHRHHAEVTDLKSQMDEQKRIAEQEADRIAEEHSNEIHTLNERMEAAIKQVEETLEAVRTEKDTRIAELEEQLAESKLKIQQLISEKEKLALKIVDLSDTIQVRDSTIVEKDQRIAELEEQLHHINHKHDELEKSLHDTRHHLHETQDALETKKKENADLEEIIRRLTEEKDQSENNLRQELEKAHSEIRTQVIIISEKNAEIEDLRAKLAKALKELAAANQELNKYLSIFKSVKQTVNEANTEED